ncbi:hypothetical protein M5D96_012153, partial [Drosophila gunungcola]
NTFPFAFAYTDGNKPQNNQRHFYIRHHPTLPSTFHRVSHPAGFPFVTFGSHSVFSFFQLVDICKYECSRAIITKMLHTQIIPK